MSAPTPPLARIQAHALEHFRGRTAPGFERLHLYIAPAPLATGTRLGLGGRHSQQIPRPAILVLADLLPGAPWGHPCELHFYNPQDGEHWGWMASQHAPHLWFEQPERFLPLHTPLALPPTQSPTQSGTAPLQAPPTSSGRTYALLYAETGTARPVLARMTRVLEDIHRIPPAHILNPTEGEADPAWLADCLALLGPSLGPHDHLLLQLLPHPQAPLLQAAELTRLLDRLPSFASLIVLAETPAPDTWAQAVMRGSTAMDTCFTGHPGNPDGVPGASGVPITHAAHAAHDYPFSQDWLDALAHQFPADAPRFPFPASCGEAFTRVRARHPEAVQHAHPADAAHSLGLGGPRGYSFSGVHACCGADGHPEILLQGLDGAAWHVWRTPEGPRPWSSPSLLRADTQHAPLPVRLEDGRPGLLVLARNLALWRGEADVHGQFGPGGPWQRLPGQFRQISTATQHALPAQVFGLSPAGQLLALALTPGTPLAPSRGGPFQKFTLSHDDQDQTHLLGLNLNGEILHRTLADPCTDQAPGQDPWAPWSNWGGNFHHLCATHTPRHGLEVLGVHGQEVWWKHPAASIWQRLGAQAQRCWALTGPDGSLDVLTLGPDESLRHLHREATGRWTHWQALGGILRQLAPLRGADGRLQVFGIGPDWGLWAIQQSHSGAGPWGRWHKIA